MTEFNIITATTSSLRTKINFSECDENSEKTEIMNIKEDTEDWFDGFSETDFNDLEVRD